MTRTSKFSSARAGLKGESFGTHGGHRDQDGVLVDLGVRNGGQRKGIRTCSESRERTENSRISGRGIVCNKVLVAQPEKLGAR